MATKKVHYSIQYKGLDESSLYDVYLQDDGNGDKLATINYSTMGDWDKGIKGTKAVSAKDNGDGIEIQTDSQHINLSYSEFAEVRLAFKAMDEMSDEELSVLKFVEAD